MNRKFKVYSPQEMLLLGESIGKHAFSNMVITMHGDLGAGKTMLSKGIAKGMGVSGVVNSPTFTIMKIYQGKFVLYHMDVYRLDNANDDFDLEEYFEKDGVCIIEWAEHIQEILPKDFLDVQIIRIDDTTREVQITASSSTYQSILGEIHL